MTLLDRPQHLARPLPFAALLARHPEMDRRKLGIDMMGMSDGAAENWIRDGKSPRYNDVFTRFARHFPVQFQESLLVTATRGSRWSFHLQPPVDASEIDARRAIRTAVNAAAALVVQVVEFRPTRDADAMDPLEAKARIAIQAIEEALAGCRSMIQTRRPSIDGGER